MVLLMLLGNVMGLTVQACSWLGEEPRTELSAALTLISALPGERPRLAAAWAPFLLSRAHEQLDQAHHDCTRHERHCSSVHIAPTAIA